ncbi:MAG: hypothetical protein SF172_04340 [Burkholderiales bacterium]|nr:hypothetical protein [Burkholderiales bacterium]
MTKITESFRFNDFLDAACVQLGFCLGPDARRSVMSCSFADTQGLALAVFAAEKLRPESDKNLLRQLEELARKFA